MLFGKFGNVEGAEILYNDRGSKGFGFVTMSRGQDADLARARLNHSIVEGRIIEVKLASPKVKKERGEDLPPGVSIPVTLASRCLGCRKSLVEAETKMYEAQLEVLKLHQQLQRSNNDKSTVRSFSSLLDL